MSEFFKSSVVKEEILEISELQEKVYSKLFEFPRLDREEKINHILDLENLMEKQRVLYTRLSLSDDPDAKEMKRRIEESASLMGLSRDIDMNLLFTNMSKLIQNLKAQLREEKLDT